MSYYGSKRRDFRDDRSSQEVPKGHPPRKHKKLKKERHKHDYVLEENGTDTHKFWSSWSDQWVELGPSFTDTYKCRVCGKKLHKHDKAAYRKAHSKPFRKGPRVRGKPWSYRIMWAERRKNR